MNDETIPEARYVGLFRRLFAIFYDCFLLIAILFIVSGIATALNGGKAVEPGDAIYPILVILILLLCYLYFSWFWINGGQSLGMKTWRIQLKSNDHGRASDSSIDHKTAAIRFFTALISWGFFGLGFLWALFDKQNRCWHDISSKTVLIDLRTRRD
ncbi:MAG: RDD family protein [Gammaproteobacteria bacterium]|nr:RDD family protein [Gammaproteobacteria bacterium]